MFLSSSTSFRPIHSKGDIWKVGSNPEITSVSLELLCSLTSENNSFILYISFTVKYWIFEPLDQDQVTDNIELKWQFYCSCPKDDTYVAYPVRERFGRFRFSSFRFLRHLPTVYLHCEVFICDSMDSSSRCNEGCRSRSKRDISSYKWKGHAMAGPLRLKRDHRSVERSGKYSISRLPYFP